MDLHIPYDPPYCSEDEPCGGGGSGEGFTLSEGVWTFTKTEGIIIESTSEAIFIQGEGGVAILGAPGAVSVTGEAVAISSNTEIALAGSSLTFNGNPVGGPPDSHLSISTNNLGAALSSGTPLVLSFDDTNDFSFFFQRGSDITWSAGNPSRITIATTGVYDINTGSLFVPTSTDTPISFQIELRVNGLADPRNLTFSTQHWLTNLNATHVFNNAASGWELDAGDYLELVVSSTDADAAGNTGLIIYGAISVTRRV